MKALAIVGCILGGAGFLLATYSAVAPNKMARALPAIEEGRTIQILDNEDVDPPAPSKGGCCKPKAQEAKKAHNCKMGCED